MAIARWAVRTGVERILEPSAGSGSLVRAALLRAKSVTSSQRCSVLAFDIDPIAIANLQALGGDAVAVVHADFLSSSPSDHAEVDLVLANPPFNRNHSIEPEIRKDLRERFKTSGAIGIWGHFLLHSLTFLRKDGRLASIVPRSALFTVHGDMLLSRLCSHFSSIGIYELTSKPQWSNSADEAGAVILAEGYDCGPARSYTRGLLRDDGTAVALNKPDNADYQKLLESSRKLSDVSTLSIGAVTGRNRVFLLSEEERRSAGIELEDVCPIVSRSNQLSGVKVTKGDLAKCAESGCKTWLLRPREMSENVRRYLSVIPKADLETVAWFKKRDPWWRVQIAPVYDAVFTYMNDFGPRVVRLEHGIVCTNTLHRIHFKDGTTESERDAAVLTPLSTFGQLAAEKIGRSYGGGVLKFELVEARQFPVLAAGKGLTSEVLLHVDRLLREGLKEEARVIVDNAFMPHVFGKNWISVQADFEAELNQLRSTRRNESSRINEQ